MADRAVLIMRKVFITLGIITLTVGGCHRLFGPFYYYSDPIRATVIDEPTGQPLEGAVVVARWIAEGWGLDDYLYTAEAVTNGTGEFVIPAMPIRLRPPMNELRWRDPWILVYKPGYFIANRHNKDAYIFPITPVGVDVVTTTLPDGRIVTPGAYSRATKRFCYWDGKIIPLAPVKTVEDEVDALSYMTSEATGRRGMAPSQFPAIWRALVHGYQRFPTNAKPKVADPSELLRSIAEMK